jgi:hypothetical protein
MSDVPASRQKPILCNGHPGRNEKRANPAGLSIARRGRIAYPWAIVVLSTSGFWTLENSTAKPFSR